MRTPRTIAMATVALAVLADCQTPDLPTGPASELAAAKGGKGGGGSPAPTTVIVTGGFWTPGSQPVQIVTDGARKLELHADQAVFRSSIDLENTVAAGTAACVTDPANVSEERKEELLARMADAEQNRFFNAVVDRQRLGSGSATHAVAHTWTDEDGKLFSLRIGEASALLPGAVATVTQVSPDVYRFSGGAARIIDRTGSVKNHVYMACPNLDEVVVALSR